ncbi:hypothetical protein P692DRAFT_20829711 [Suillus brevipes Sb2]|nr:hypothetical protein P692DRAFT_20829711 [Suillus brevipes Sb2]
MRFSSAIALAVVAALASSTSATPRPVNAVAKPINAVEQHCEVFCAHDYQCDTCMTEIS